VSEFLTGVTEKLTREHADPLGLEGVHSHTWTITAWWPAEPLRDGRALKASLRMFLDVLPDPLPPDLWAGERLAEWVMVLAGVVGVDVDRDEGFHVRLRR
jgi:hypothetical protein